MATKNGRTARRKSAKTGDSGLYPLAANPLERLTKNLTPEQRINPEAPLLPNPRTGEPYRQGKLLEILKDACAAGKVDHIPPYQSMKHAPRTALGEAGESVTDVQAAIGHTNSRTTNLYIAEQAKRNARAAAKLTELMDDAKKQPEAVKGG